jgi:uncharacterized repeat protein (TIGR03803 family)
MYNPRCGAASAVLRFPKLTRKEETSVKGKQSFVRFIGSVLVTLLALHLFLGAAWAQKEKVLYSFCPQRPCTDGVGPDAGVVLDKNGSLYGTTYYGGDSDAGVVFKVTPSGKETVLYSFCSMQNCADGADPFAGVIFDGKGNLYGTTQWGGISNTDNCSNGCGVVFKITPSGKETVLYTFCSVQNCADGAQPYAGLVFDKEGNLYGTTSAGGSGCSYQYCGHGTVFRVTPSGKETVLYSFCSQSACTDGAIPWAGVIFDAKGNLYGTTFRGGDVSGSCTHACGVVFKLDTNGKETVLYNFCSEKDCADGAEPYAGLVFDKKGNLYGTTNVGGAYSAGTVFEITPSGKQSVLYSFCSQGGTHCRDGASPFAGLVFDKRGNLYGTTLGGGHLTYENWGTVFKLTPSGEETVLYSFGSHVYDGWRPYGGLVFDEMGNLYGTTLIGGHQYGTVFKLTP